MMYGYGPAAGGIGVFGFLIWSIVFVDLVLVGMWLWKEISKK